MFPTIFALGLAKLGPLTGDGAEPAHRRHCRRGYHPPVAQGWFARPHRHPSRIHPPSRVLRIHVYYGLRGSRPVVPAGA